MDICVIGDREYSVLITSIVETFDKLYSENTGRTMSSKATMNLDCLGTFFGHKVEFARKSGYELEYDELFDLLSTPTNSGMKIKLVHNQTSIEYEAYVSNGQRSVKRIDEKNGKVYWDKLSVNFIPMEAYYTVD